MTGSTGTLIPSPEDIRKYCEYYFPSNKNGFDILDAPDPVLSWLLGTLHRIPGPAPSLSAEEWEEMVSLLNPHGIIPYLTCLLTSMPPESQPPSHVRKAFVINYLQSSFHAEQALKQSVEVSMACEHEGINVLVLKSPAIGQIYYPEPGLRIGSDIDLLVSPEQYEKCREVLCGIGYDLRYDTHSVMPQFYHHACYYPPEKKASIIELHWRPLFLPGPGDRVNIPDLIARSQKIQTRYGHLYALDPPDALCYSSIHMSLFHEPVLRLSWVCDIKQIAEYITAKAIWPRVISRSAEWQSKSAVERAIGLASQWMGLTIPEEHSFSSWPEAGADEEYALSHMQKRREGKELLLHQILARMPTYPLKAKAMYHWVFRPDLIHDRFPHMRWWQYPVEYSRMLYCNYQQIRK